MRNTPDRQARDGTGFAEILYVWADRPARPRGAPLCAGRCQPMMINQVVFPVELASLVKEVVR